MQPESMTDAQAIIILALRRLERAGVDPFDPACIGLQGLLGLMRAYERTEPTDPIMA